VNTHEKEPPLQVEKIAATDGEHVRFGKALGTRRMLPATATFLIVERY
jgi:hypothetical protein